MATTATSKTVSTQTSVNSLPLAEVPRFSKEPIRKVPQYVFENCNQVTVNSYDPEALTMLKTRMQSLTSEQLKKMCLGDQKKFVQKGEEYDWINGLVALEKECLEGKNPDQMMDAMLKVDAVMRMNGIFSRFSNDAPGEFRKRDIIWPRRDMHINETFCSCFFDPEFKKKMGTTQSVYFTRDDNRLKECLVRKGWITREYNRLQREGFQIPADQEQWWKEHQHEINIPQAVDSWLQEQNSKDDKLDLVQWFKTRYHYFPLVSTLPADLEKSLAEVREAKDMHPIEKACKVWFDIVRIHISHEANKRTGKALASIILLSHGYLPPLIGKEDEREYLDVIQKGMEEKDGHLRLTQFVAKTMAKTHQAYAAAIPAPASA